MIDCVFEKNEQGTFTCPVCNLTVPYLGIKANCKGSSKVVNKPPKLINKVANFVAAATQHAIAGNPTVTEEQMKARLVICQGCELFKLNKNAVGGVCTHETCGCNIQDNLNYLNKIAWADQECPIGKWGKETPNSGV